MPALELVVDAFARELAREGVDLEAWALSTARVLPSVILIPAFGLRALPILARAVAALALAACTAPALSNFAPRDTPWLVTLLSQVVIGLPVAVGAATTLWAATMAGNLIDEVARTPARPHAAPVVDSPASPLGLLVSLGAAVAFLGLGGPARVVAALAVPNQPFGPATKDVVVGLLGGVRVAVLLSAPLLVLGAFFELVHGLVARATSPTPVSSVMAPARFVAVFSLAALLLDRVVEGLALWMSTRLPPG